MDELRLLRWAMLTTALIAVVFSCLLSGLWDDTQARLSEQGSYAIRCGPHPSGLAM